jgi:SAM-dependent methyltransferase
MDPSNQEFLNSLDLPDREIEAFIPVILGDLWELGSMPEYIVGLVRKHIDPDAIQSIVDLGCGKGAVLIKLALEFRFDGLGIDIVPEFIASARQYAQEYGVADSVEFKVGDIRNAVAEIRDRDIVIYGYDSAVLGDEEETLLQLKNCLAEEGWIIFEVAYTPDDQDRIDGISTESELNRRIDASGLKTIEKVVWDKNELKRVNDRNNKSIQAKIAELIEAHPGKAHHFQRYMDNQIKECAEIENDMVCSTWLLRKISRGNEFGA